MDKISRRLIVACASATALLLAGVGVAGATGTPIAAPQRATMTGYAPLNAQMVTPDFGWVLTPDRLLVTRDGGKTFTTARVPLPDSYARNAVFTDAAHGLAAAAVGNRVTVARTADGGRSWTVSVVAEPALNPRVGYGNLSVAAGPGSSAAILAQVATGQNMSLGTLFTTNGTGWMARQAPAGGTVAVDAHGKVWLAGGVFGTELFSSADRGASWARSTVALEPGQRLAALSTPADGTVSATALTTNGTSQVDLLSTADNGRSWHAVSAVSMHGHATMGVLMPVAATAHGPLALDTAGGAVYRSQGRWAAVRASGLPEGTTTTSFAPNGTDGWALATYGKCLTFKTNCTLYHELAATTDGGATWHQLEMWVLPIG